MISAKFVALFPKMKIFTIHRANRRIEQVKHFEPLSTNFFRSVFQPSETESPTKTSGTSPETPGRENLHYCQLAETCLVVSIHRKHKGKGMRFSFQQPFVGGSAA